MGEPGREERQRRAPVSKPTRTRCSNPPRTRGQAQGFDAGCAASRHCPARPAGRAPVLLAAVSLGAPVSLRRARPQRWSAGDQASADAEDPAQWARRPRGPAPIGDRFGDIGRRSCPGEDFDLRMPARCVLLFAVGSQGPTREWRNGRRAGFRCQCPLGRGGSTPLSRTTMYGPLTTSNPL